MGTTDKADCDRGGVVSDVPAGLTAFQVSVATLFFSLPASDGFLLAGGAALAAQELTSRPTQDLDLFTRAGRGTVPAARDAFEAAAHTRGWSVRRIRDTATFCRLVVSGDDELLVDLALDSPPNLPPTASIAGPTFGLEELAGRKVIALFDRAEARDFADVFTLAQRYEKSCSCAAQPRSTLDSTEQCSPPCCALWAGSPTTRFPSTRAEWPHCEAFSADG